MRVYIPVHAARLPEAVAGRWEPSRAYAVTDTLLHVSSLEDDEELAELVRDAAAMESVAELGSPLRAVIVADYARADVAAVTGDHPAAVEISGRVVADAVACAFVDDAEVSAIVARASAGDVDAWEELAEHDLLWFDASEVPHLPPLTAH